MLKHNISLHTCYLHQLTDRHLQQFYLELVVVQPDNVEVQIQGKLKYSRWHDGDFLKSSSPAVLLRLMASRVSL